MNLLPGITLSDIEADFRQGDGNELEPRDCTPPKFCAVHSSSALAVNSFGLFRNQPHLFSYKGLSDISSVAFEQKLPTGLTGTSPNLDIYLEGPNTCLAVESKFTEILNSKTPFFRESYDERIMTLGDTCWKQLYESIRSDPDQYQYLDVAQLIKHYLGIVYTLSKKNKACYLLYIYWLPKNWNQIETYRIHDEECRRMKSMLNGSRVTFWSIDYGQFWQGIDTQCSVITKHINLWKERYVFSLPNN
jgi:hypothetical protein